MTAAPGRDRAAPSGSDGDACPQCGNAAGTLALLTSMTRYYVCGSCARRWSVARDWLRASMPPTA